ncbi:unnamed protein product [Prunus armeniaca]|uniref:Uncharacterized protein n=1 Tax=Prunus armeniaca TaxID=36596 RepID=A0A6J5W064_PRUAR|nr:hypothetical protein GBA52_000978 [Prunus armeniaca]CAB4293641.1 unnamed protein product [Prunus armeniaca]
MVAGQQNSGEGVITTNYWFKPKKGSVFPAKRKLVKTMVFESIVKWVASVFCSAHPPPPPPPPSGASANEPNMTPVGKVANSKKCKQIAPQ